MAGERVAFLIDVAGAEEAAFDTPGQDRDPDKKRDATVLTIASIDTTHPEDTAYHVLDRYSWTGTPWETVQGALKLLMLRWNPVLTLVDATGIGFGMYSHLRATHKKHRVEPFIFTAKSKSDLGWSLVALIDAGRLDHFAHDGADDTVEFWRQANRTTFTIRPGEARLMQWSVPEAQGHDDAVLSLALIAELDRLNPRPRIARGT